MQLSTSEKILIYSSKINLSAKELEHVNTVGSLQFAVPTNRDLRYTTMGSRVAREVGILHLR